MFEEDTHIEREKQQAEGKHANAPVGRTELRKWTLATLDAIKERLDDDADYTEQWMNDFNAVFKKWAEAMNGRLKECDYSNNEIEKKLAVLDKKEARIDAAILRAETLEKCYINVFKSALDKNSFQPQGTPAPVSNGDAQIEGTPAPSVALPAPVVAVQYVPKLEEVLNHPSAAQLGKKSIRLLQELAGIMNRKALFVFTHDNVQDWLDISRGTSYGHIAAWQKFGFIEKKGSVYRFVPPPPATTAPTPQEGSQPVV